MPGITPETLALLRRNDTPTVCNALEHVMGGRTAEGFTKSPTVCADPSLPPVVGFARTARIRASSPAQKPAAEVRALRMQYYEYVSAGEGPNVVVIEDTEHHSIPIKPRPAKHALGLDPAKPGEQL